MKIIIIGAGLSGLTAAMQLIAHGHEVVVLDKGRGAGGRLATRRGDDGLKFDHGAQYFTVRSPEFAQEVAQWEAEGIVKIWADDFPADESRLARKRECYPRYIGTQGMAGIAKHLCQRLPIKLNTKVTTISAIEQPASIRVTTEEGDHYTADDALLTAPVPQTLQLLEQSSLDLEPSLHAKLAAVQYAPCLALLITLKEPSRLPPPGGLFIGPEPIAWMADQTQRGITSSPAVVVHAGPEFSKKHYDSPESEVVAMLLDQAQNYCGTVVSATLHRWRYSLPTVTFPERTAMQQLANGRRLWFAGDAFGGPRVEGAYLSGRAAAAAIIAQDTRSVL